MYTGGKNNGGAYQTIINNIPPHETYIELFLGSGAVMRNKRPARLNIGIDRRADLVDIFDYPGEMQFYEDHYLNFLQRTDHHKKKTTFIYADPPYLFSSRRSSRPLYEYEFTDADHENLLTELKAAACMVAISGYETELYNEMLKGWRKVFYYQVDRGGNRRKECLYCNYPAPRKLHEYTYLGTDSIDRQRIRRKISRHIQRLELLPVLERNAILTAIKQSAEA